MNTKAGTPRLYSIDGLRFSPEIRLGPETIEVSLDGSSWQAGFQEAPGGAILLRQGDRVSIGYAARKGDRIWVHLDGRTWSLTRERETRRRPGSAPAGEVADEIRAPMVGTVRSTPVAAGDEVTKGRPVLIVEAMKMEHVLKAPRDGKVEAVLCQTGDLVDLGQVVLRMVRKE